MGLYSRADLENSPSRRAGLSVKMESQFRWAACDLIKECGQRLKIPQLTIATATVFCHRFYAVHAHNQFEHDWHVVAPASLFLAGKVEETPKALRDVVYVSYILRHRKDPDAAEKKLKDKEVVHAAGELILAAERKLLHTLGFEFSVTHPYTPLAVAIKKMRTTKPWSEDVKATRELFQVAWNFINDSLRTTLSLQYDAKAIAAAAMYLAARFKKAELPQLALPSMGDGGEGAEWWFSTFGTPASPEVAEDIGNQILDLYKESGKPPTGAMGTMLADAAAASGVGEAKSSAAAQSHPDSTLPTPAYSPHSSKPAPPTMPAAQQLPAAGKAQPPMAPPLTAPPMTAPPMMAPPMMAPPMAPVAAGLSGVGRADERRRDDRERQQHQGGGHRSRSRDRSRAEHGAGVRARSRSRSPRRERESWDGRRGGRERERERDHRERDGGGGGGGGGGHRESREHRGRSRSRERGRERSRERERGRDERPSREQTLTRPPGPPPERRASENARAAAEAMPAQRREVEHEGSAQPTAQP